MSLPYPILHYPLCDKYVTGLLPANYSPLAYFESVSDVPNYFNLGLNKIAGEILVSGKVLATDIYGERDWIGNYYDRYGTGFAIGLTSGEHYLYYQGATLGGIVKANEIYEECAHVTHDVGKLNVNGETYNGSARCHDSSSDSDVALFKPGDIITDRQWRGRIYSAKVWNKGGQVDVIPADYEDGFLIAVYNIESSGTDANEFSSGEIIEGPPIANGKYCGSSLPEEYQQVEGLHFPAGKAMSTGVSVGANQEVVMKLGIRYDEGGSGRDLWGWSGSAAGYTGVTSSGSWEVHGNLSRQTSNIYKHNNLIWTQSDPYSGTLQIGGLTNTYNPRGKWISHCNVTVAGVQQIDWWACYRKSDMMPGFYDTVSNTFLADSSLGLGLTVNTQYTCQPNASFVNNPPLCPQDPTIYTEPDGTTWIRIVHHAPHETSNLFDINGSWTTGYFKNYDAWFYGHLCNYITNGKWELMIKEKTTSSASEAKYRWIQYSNPMTCAWSDVTGDKITKINSSGYSSMGTNGLFYHPSSGTYLSYDNGTSGSNWYGIGAYYSYNGGFPSLNNGTVTTGYSDLYLRVNKQPALYTKVSCKYINHNYWSAHCLGNGSHIKLPALGSEITNGTIAVWCKLNQPSHRHLFIGNDAGNKWIGAWETSNRALYSGSSGSITNYIDGEPNNIVPNDQDWHFYCFTGVNLTQWGSQNLYLNHYGSTNYNVSCQYKQFMLFDTALTAAQVKELYGK